MSARVETVTLGCRLNIVESEALAREARARGEEDFVVVNTCAVTSEAARQSRQTVRRLRRERPDARILATGCAATLAPQDFATDDGAVRVLANDAKSHTGTLQEALAASEGTRGFLAIQNGCDHRCTFCIIPFGRGASRSAPLDDVIESARRLAAVGKREIVLTGVDLTAYGADIGGGVTLAGLTRRLLAELPELPRLRLSSIDCIEAGPDFVAAMGEEPRLMPHLHLSLQAGDDLILKRMKRRHARSEAIGFCRALRRARPDIVFGADFIVGFPTETEDMFRRTLDLVEECGATHLHVFPFSPRPGTPAALMPQVPRDIVKERAERLRALGAARLRLHLEAQRGKTLRVLAERGGVARAEDFTQLRTPGAAAGDIFDVNVAGCDAAALLVAARARPAA